MPAPAAAAQPDVRPMPSSRAAAVFAGKVALLRLRRSLQELGTRPRRLAQGRHLDGDDMVAESRTPLWSDTHPAERRHQLGKVHNLRRAARALDGVEIPGGATFSFWRQLGRASRGRGFVSGRMLQGGCMVPATGGGLCQLSNALHDVALQAGCDILERHAHSRVVPGSTAVHGRDATVAWNYVDLRFRPRRMLRLSVRLTRDELVVRLHGTGGTGRDMQDEVPHEVRPQAGSCGTCAQTGCFRHEHGAAHPVGRQAFLVNEAWPEFVSHVAAVRRRESSLGLPLPGWLRRPQRYDWPTGGFASVTAAPLAALKASLAIRLAGPGAARRRAEAAGAAGLAHALAPLLTPDVAHLWVAQAYLPYLWRDGHLGGRRFSVLMTRLPMQVLQARLDAAFAAYPDRATLADFRAPPELVAWEAAALAQAEAVATPHAEVAALFAGRATRLDWRAPGLDSLERTAPVPRRIAFPGPTLARKGAYEVREAARALDLEVLLLGAELQGARFWNGVRTCRPDPAAGPFGWLRGVFAVVQPALVEEQPRRLLAARAAGVPVVATAACGLDGEGVTGVAPLDPAGLTDQLRRLLPPGLHPGFYAPDPGETPGASLDRARLDGIVAMTGAIEASFLPQGHASDAEHRAPWTPSADRSSRAAPLINRHPAPERTGPPLPSTAGSGASRP